MEQSTPVVKTKKKSSVLKMVKALVLVAMLVGLVGLGYLYYQTRIELQFLASPDGQDELARREVGQVVAALGKLAILPEEEPVIATITDYEALASQSAFYTNSLNGDKLVVYPQAKQAFIFSPSRNKIVNVGPLLIEDAPLGENSQGTTEQVSAQKVSVEVRNGSGVAGKATSLSQQLSSTYELVSVTAVVDAATDTYQGITVVDNSKGKFAALAQSLAKELNGKVSTLPTTESSSLAELIILVGN